MVEDVSDIPKSKHKLENIIKEGRYALISAEKAGMPKEVNKQKDKELRHELKALKLPYNRTLGVYKGTPEKSVLVYDISRNKALELGKEYGQESIVHGNTLYSTSPELPEEKFGEVLAEFKPEDTLFESRDYRFQEQEPLQEFASSFPNQKRRFRLR